LTVERMASPADDLRGTAGVVAAVRVTPVAVPLTRPMVWAGGRDEHAIQILVEVETDTGLVGLGEAMAALNPGVVGAAVRDFAGQLIGHPADDLASLETLWFGSGRWRFFRRLANYAVSALEMALWDIRGQALGLPVHALLGGRIRDSVDHFFWIHRGDEDPVAQAERGLAAGFRVFYFKVGIDGESSEDVVELVRAVRASLGPDSALRIDANQAWSPEQAVSILRALEDCHLDWVEEPVAGTDVRDLLYVRQETGVPVAVDQGAWLERDIVRLASKRAVDVVCTDASRLGGLLAFTRLAATLDELGIGICRHCGNEFGVFLAASLQACAHAPNLTTGNQHFDLLAWDVVAQDLTHPTGAFPVSTRPGLGVTLDPQRFGEARDCYLALDRP
jgi:L-alanine-DL-glutamate epimerase-like enolase superfamily enzyme